MMVDPSTPYYLSAIYSLSKKDFELAAMYLSDTYKYVPVDFYADIKRAQDICLSMAEVMGEYIKAAEEEDSYQTLVDQRKNKEEKENG